MVRTVARIIWQALNAYGTDHASSFAAAVAYYMLFSIFPLVLFFISFSGYFITQSQRENLVLQISSLFGGASTTEIYREILKATNGRAGLGLLSLAAALWSASAVFGALRTGLGAVWRWEHGRPWWLSKMDDLIGVICLGAMLGLALATTIVLTTVTNRVEQLLGAQVSQITSLFLSVIFVVLPIFLAFITFLVLYALASPPYIRLRHVWLGAAIAAVGYQIISLGFGFYVRYFAHYDRLYGSIGAAIAFLFFAYLMGSAILFGAEISESYMEWATGRRTGDRVLTTGDVPSVEPAHPKMPVL
jgi:membrane protein